MWWESRRNVFEIFISQLVIDEASAGNPDQAKLRLGALHSIPQLEIIEESVLLADEFLRAGIIPSKAATDAAHIALAAIHGMDYLMTWNCKHIANATIFEAIREICFQQGYTCPVICTPEELLGE